MPKVTLFHVSAAIKLDDGRVLPWGNTDFSLKKESGEYCCECLKHEFDLAQEDRLAYEKVMLERVGEQMSLRFSQNQLPPGPSS